QVARDRSGRRLCRRRLGARDRPDRPGEVLMKDRLQAPGSRLQTDPDPLPGAWRLGPGALLLALAAMGCGTGGATGGPPQNAPVSGAAGFAKVPGDYVLLDSVPLTDPALLTSSAQGPFALWVTRDGNEIWRTALARLGTDPTPLRSALTATEPWEMGTVGK